MLKKSYPLCYPPDIQFEANLSHFGRWPTKDFFWVTKLMKKSEVSMAISPEIIQYHSLVLGNTPVDPIFTKNIIVIEAILYFLGTELGIGERGTILELCSGTGVITTPLAKYFDIVAVEKNREYLRLHRQYLNKTGVRKTEEIRKSITIYEGDVANRNGCFGSREINSINFDAIVMAPPFSLIPDTLRAAERVKTKPKIIIGVFPLDIIDEADGGYCKHRFEPGRIFERDIEFIRGFRNRWELIAIEPLVQEDNSARVGVFLFRLAKKISRQ